VRCQLPLVTDRLLGVTGLGGRSAPGRQLEVGLRLPLAAVPYSSEPQQPMRATAVLGTYRHMHWAAPFDREQGRAGSSHQEGQYFADQTWTKRRVGSSSSQPGVLPTYSLRSREPRC
jgi:hypothetical protein